MKRMWSKNELKEIVKGTQGYNFANLVDKNGNPRFIDGDIELEDNTGLTLTYGKWSLSGSHLLIVLAGSVADETIVPSGTIAKINLPEWVKDKIVPIASTIVESKTTPFYDSNLTVQNLVNFLEKYNANKQVSIYLIGFTADADRNFRIAFDLLIDNE